MIPDDILLETNQYRLNLSLKNGIHLAGIRHLMSGHDFLTESSAKYFGNPFCLRLKSPVSGGFDYLNSGLEFEVIDVQRELADDGQSYKIWARSKRGDLETVLSITAPTDGPVSLWKLKVKNISADPIRGEAFFPLFTGIVPGGDLLDLDACLPMQLGGVYGKIIEFPHSPLFFFPYNMAEDAQLTYASPYSMPLVDLFNARENEGLFMIILPEDMRRFTLCISTIGEPVTPFLQAGFEVELEPGEEWESPQALIGVHTGGWEEAVETYLARVKDRFVPREIPAWFHEAGAIYGVGGVGGGGGFLAFGTVDGKEITRFGGSLNTEMRSFNELPLLLKRAQEMGTNVLYLWDYWEGEPATGMPAYWNKGDYIIREDLGGESAFRAGIDEVHRQGGKVLVYVEGFIVYKNSILGKTKARKMALMDAKGSYYEDYFNYWSMCPADFAWQEELAGICTRLVQDYDVDGIFLDSYGAQWNHPCYNPNHSHRPATDVWNSGLLEMLDTVRAAVRRVKPEAVVMTESSNETMLPHEDGSCDGSLVWHASLNRGRITASPYKLAYPTANIFSNGFSLSQMKQVFAAGCGLAIGPAWSEDSELIAQLVRIKKEHRDVLIYGKMINAPKTLSNDVAVFAYEGNENLVVQIMNTGDTVYQGQVMLPAGWEQYTWERIFADPGAQECAHITECCLMPGELNIWVAKGLHDSSKS